MKPIRNCVAAALAIVATVGVAHAGTISFSDTFDPTDQRFNNVSPGTFNCTGTNGVGDSISGQSLGGECESLAYTHVLLGFVPATDTLASATLSIWVYDDATNEPASEKLDYSFDLGSLTGDFPAVSLNGFTQGSPFHFSIGVLPQIATDGTLAILLELKAGDMMFAKSELSARGDRDEFVIDPQTPTVPEPTALALLGLAAVASFGRKRFA